MTRHGVEGRWVASISTEIADSEVHDTCCFKSYLKKHKVGLGKFNPLRQQSFQRRGDHKENVQTPGKTSPKENKTKQKTTDGKTCHRESRINEINVKIKTISLH